VNLRSEVAYLTLPPGQNTMAHLTEPLSTLTYCGQRAQIFMGILPIAESEWPTGPRCPQCFTPFPFGKNRAPRPIFGDTTSA
jgi:hypothetical protein